MTSIPEPIKAKVAKPVDTLDAATARSNAVNALKDLCVTTPLGVFVTTLLVLWHNMLRNESSPDTTFLTVMIIGAVVIAFATLMTTMNNIFVYAQNKLLHAEAIARGDFEPSQEVQATGVIS